MKFNTQIACLPLAAILLVSSLAASAQSPVPNWGGVKALKADSEIRVVVGSRTFRGEMRSVTDDSLVVASGKGQEMFTRQEITRVSVRSGSRRGRHALIGAVIGGAGGAVFGGGVTAGAGYLGATPAVAGAFGGAGALVGALVGMAIPSGDWREIYKK